MRSVSSGAVVHNLTMILEILAIYELHWMQDLPSHFLFHRSQGWLKKLSCCRRLIEPSNHEYLDEMCIALRSHYGM